MELARHQKQVLGVGVEEQCSNGTWVANKCQQGKESRSFYGHEDEVFANNSHHREFVHTGNTGLLRGSMYGACTLEGWGRNERHFFEANILGTDFFENGELLKFCQ